MRELYINDKLIELSDNNPIGITYCANNIGELQNRNSSFSNTIKIPITQHNKIALDWSHLVNSSTDLPYIKLKATYIENGIELVSNGTGIINSVDENYFNINILSGNFDLSELLGDKTIGELYGADSFVWNKSNIIASNDRSKPYIYPVIDWRSDSDSFFTKDSVAKCDYLLPCLRVKDVFKKIEDYVNFSFVGSYIATTDHDNMVLTPDYFEYEIPSTITATNKAYGLWKTSFNVGIGSSVINTAVYPKLDTFEANMGYTTYTYFQPSVLKYGKLSFASTVVLNWYSVGNYAWYQNKQKKNITIKAYIKDDLGNVHGISELINENTELNYSKEFVVNVETPENFAFNPLRKYYVRITVYTEQHTNKNSVLNIGAKVNTNDLFVFTESKFIGFNQSIKYSDIFRMKVKDVLKDILNLRGLIIQTNSYLRTIQINNFDDLRANKSIAKDWSSKVNSISSLKYTFGNYAQKNYLKFKEFETVAKEYGDSYFSISNLNLDIDKTAVQIQHPATEQKFKYLGANIPKITGLDINKEWKKPQYRLLTLNTEYRVINYTDTTTTTEMLSNVPFCKFETFASIIPNHYKVLNEILENTKVITATIKLNGKDVNELDFSIPVYLDVPEFSISNYFYINRINDYRKGLTNVELVRI